jgi:hypothetical protein
MADDPPAYAQFLRTEQPYVIFLDVTQEDKFEGSKSLYSWK